MVKIFFMVLFSVKVISVISVCVPVSEFPASAYSNCDTGNYALLSFIDMRVNTDAMTQRFKQKFSTFKECADNCYSDLQNCLNLDYNCKTGDCVFFSEMYGAGFEPFFAENGHISVSFQG